MRGSFQVAGEYPLTRSSVRCIAFATALSLLLLAAASVQAQIVNYADQGKPPPAGLELLQEEPHDLIFFTPDSGGGWLKALLLDVPGREMPTDVTGTLTFQVVSIEGKKFSARWKDIADIDFWEKRLERETVERIQAGDFVGAYPFLSILIRDYPSRPGLRRLRSEFLLQDAIRRFRAGELDSTLAMLEELRRYAPEYETAKVVSALGMVTDRLMQRMADEGDLYRAQQLLSRLKTDYSGVDLSSIGKWDSEFLRMATEKQKEAIDAARKGDFRTARRAARESVALKPEIENGKELIQKIDEVYPLVNVGVLQTATELDPTRLDNWAARRAGRLMYRVLFEMNSAGPEGGEYEFLFGETEQTPDRLRFTMFLEPEKLSEPLNGVNGFHLADILASRARDESATYFTPWAAAIKGIGLDGPNRVDCLLRRPNVLPQALLQVTVDGSWFGGEPRSPTGDYRKDVQDGDLVRYVIRGEQRTKTQPKELVEIRCETAADGVSRLLRGEIDVLDQLFPADAVRLRKSRTIRVANYPLPSVHMLIPCSDHAYLDRATFRRALVYGTNRADILGGELLGGAEVPGCQVLSGPFPAGLDASDPLGYAYDREILPLEYEPRLAKLLMTMNANQMEAEAERKEEEMPEMTPIRLAHPPENLSRTACEAMRSQWALLGLEVELVELPVGKTFPQPGKADLAYVAAAVWEPIIDARRILGPRGLAGSTNQMVGLGLRRLEESKNWRDARDRLLDLHFISNTELPILPLWQMVDSFAHTKKLLGVGSDIVSLYQNAEKWRMTR
ncbi:MAG: ABC transporter substrate-binding protein [Planctomycetota bacterium]